MPFFTSDSIKKSLSGKSLGGAVKKSLSASGENKNSVSFLAEELSGKNEAERKTAYSRLGISFSGREKIEKIIGGGKESYSRAEAGKMRKAEEMKKRVNASISRRFSEDGGTRYEAGTARFAGGAVWSRSRVGSISAAPRPEQKGFAGRGFSSSSEKSADGGTFAGQADIKNNSNNPPARPIGLGSL